MEGDRQRIAERNVRQRLPHAGVRRPRRPERQRGESAGAPIDLPDRGPAADRAAGPDEGDAGFRAAHAGLVDDPGATRAPAAARATPTGQGPDPTSRSRAYRPRARTTQAVGAATSASLPAQGGAPPVPSGPPPRPPSPAKPPPKPPPEERTVVNAGSSTEPRRASSPSSTPSPVTYRTSRRDL